MDQKKNKLKLSAIVFSKDGFILKVSYCESPLLLYNWLNRSNNYQNWEYFNIYNRKTNQYIKRQYRNAKPILDRDL